MLYAFTKENIKIEPFPSGRAFCPGCLTEVIAKCGPTNSWHWAHDSLEDCDNWNYEPKTIWHRTWQNRFHVDDTEVIIKKENKFHIADIVGNNEVVIEIQNSPISADKIQAREEFYGRMIWVLNARKFTQNLDIIGFSVDIEMDSLNQYIVYEEDSKGLLKRIKLIVPIDDDMAIESCLLANKDLYQQDEDEENIWYINDVQKLNGYQLPFDLRSAYLAYALQEKFLQKNLEEKNSYQIDFRWRYIKRSWVNAKMPIFLDIAPNYLIYISKHNYGAHFEGKIISRHRFMNKYRKRLPSLKTN